MNLGLEGKVALVAGASSGLGYASALMLAQEGCDVAICGRNTERIQAAAKKIQAKTKRAVLAVDLDISMKSAGAEFVHKTIDRFGTFDIVIANAGGPPSKLIEFITEEDWEQAFQQNFMSTVRLFHEALPYLKKNKYGRMIAITSVAAKEPIIDMALSNSMRAAVHGFIKTLSTEIGYTGITVNAVMPGITNTERMIELTQQTAARENISLENARKRWTRPIPMDRMAEPSEFAALVTFLCSKQASYITGSALTADGGMIKTI